MQDYFAWTMPILDNTRTLMIVALFNQAFETSSSGHDKLKGILNVMHVRIDATDSDEDWIFGYDASRFCEWAKIAIAKHVAGDNLSLLKKFKRDTLSYKPNTYGQIGNTRFEALVTFAFFELIFLIRYLIFSTASVMMVTNNNSFFW